MAHEVTALGYRDWKTIIDGRQWWCYGRSIGPQNWPLHRVLLIVSLVTLSNILYFTPSTYRPMMGWMCLPANSSCKNFNLKFSLAKPIVIWNTDNHPAPAIDIRGFVEPLGALILQHDFSTYCQHFQLCESRKKLKVLNSDNVVQVDVGNVSAEFYAAYKDDPVMKSVDAFLCTDVVSVCQLYTQFNKTIIIVATNRYYVRRVELVDERNPTPRWHQWNSDLIRIASDPRNVVAANNQYDVNFMRYFTGINPVYIPSFAGYTNASYHPINPVYLIAKNRLSVLEDWLLGNFSKIKKPKNCLAKLERMPEKFEYQNLSSYQGIVHIPYQVSTMSIFEQYRMNMPLFFPSKRLLISWDIKHWLLRERTQPWPARNPRALPPHESQKHLPNPNDEYNEAAMDYWLQFADYYTMPYIQHFDSAEHLVEMLCRLTVEDLQAISRQMQKYNEEVKAKLSEQWKDIMLLVARNSPNHGQ